jgi:hypothetical protein
MSKLEQAIDCNDGDQAARIIQDALGIEKKATTSPATSFRRFGQPIVSSALASSASGRRPRRAF